MPAPSFTRFPRRHPVWTAAVVLLLLLVVLFDWNWLRGPVEKYISNKTQRTFSIAHLDVDFGLTPTIVLDDVHFSNASWGRDESMAQVAKLEFSVYLPSLFQEKIRIPRLALTDAKVVMELAKDGERNWRIAEPGQSGPGRALISTLAVNRGNLRFYHYGKDLEVAIDAETFDPKVGRQVTEADAEPANDRYSTRYTINGKFQGAAFSGNALTGDTLSFQQSGVPFPIKGDLMAGTTRFDMEGTITDVADLSGVDARLKIAGQTLANLYPFLLLPLPASPPYAIEGRLIRQAGRYELRQFAGKIGTTDMTGGGSYVVRDPRPLLTVDLHSTLLNISDLGPLVGVRAEQTGAKPSISQKQTNTRGKAEQAAPDRNKVLPSGKFESERFRAIDAKVNIVADKLKAPTSLPFESLRASASLDDGVLTLTPLDFGFAGGLISASVTLDGRKDVLAGDARIDLKRIHLERILPAGSTVAKSAGRLGGAIQLAGSGNSVADLMATSNGSMSMAISGGRISNLVDAASGLNGGKILRLLVGGDQDIPIRCGAAAFDIKQGKGKSTLFVVDTEQTEILGEGGFDFADETFRFKVTPQPKEKGFLSLRTPVLLHGTFKTPDYELEKGPLVARAAGAAALAIIAPFVALLPFIETGPGDDTDCRKMLAQVPNGGAKAR